MLRRHGAFAFALAKDQTDYSNLNTMIKTFEPYNNLWKTAGDWVNNKEVQTTHGPRPMNSERWCS